MEMKRTITSIFIVPTLKIDKDKLSNNGFLNGYVRDVKREVQYENCIYLLFKPNNMIRFKAFVDNEYIRTKSIVDDYDYEDGFVVLVYKLNMKFEEDFDLIKLGKYSKTSEKFQELFAKTVTVENKVGGKKDLPSLQFRIFNKSDDLREYWEDKLSFNFKDDMEVWRIYEEEKEELDIDKIKELV